jgi:hypothetical protein
VWLIIEQILVLDVSNPWFWGTYVGTTLPPSRETHQVAPPDGPHHQLAGLPIV